MSKRGMWTVKELMRPTGWRAFGAMLLWAFYFVSVIQIALFAFRAIDALFFEKKLFWDRELAILAISTVVVICYHTLGRKKEPIQ